MPNDNGCPPCKIILDGRAISASARLFAAIYTGLSGLPRVVAAANYLAAIADGATEALMYGIKSGALTADTIDKAHAFSELYCHRAAWLRDAAKQHRMTPEEQTRTATLLEAWGEELRLNTTAMIGGEYRGPWRIDGVTGISKG